MTLQVGYVEIVAEMERAFGIDASSSRTLGFIRSALDAGLRQFLNAWNWSFLTPEATLTTVAGEWEYDAPSDFQAMEGTFHFQPGKVFIDLKRVPWDSLLRSRSAMDVSGVPWQYAVAPQSSDQASAQKWKFGLHPKPDAAWSLAYRYRRAFVPLRPATPYPPGGADYGHAAMCSCLAMYEQMYMDDRAVYSQMWAEAFAAAVRLDGTGRESNLGPVSGVGPRARPVRTVDGLVQFQST